MEDSLLVKGVAFKKTFSYAGFEQQPKSFKNPKIVCLNVELELKAERDNAEVRIEAVSVRSLLSLSPASLTPPRDHRNTKRSSTRNGPSSTPSSKRSPPRAPKSSSRACRSATSRPSSSPTATSSAPAASQRTTSSASSRRWAERRRVRARISGRSTSGAVRALRRGRLVGRGSTCLRGAGRR